MNENRNQTDPKLNNEINKTPSFSPSPQMTDNEIQDMTQSAEEIPTMTLPPLKRSLLPIAFLLVTLMILIAMKGADAVNVWSPIVLLSASALAIGLSAKELRHDTKMLRWGIKKSSSQILPAVPILLFIAVLSTTWMLGGIVPTFIHYGLQYLNAKTFLVTVCAACSCISVMTGSSWTTIATIGVAFMGIGQVMGYSDPWIAGAIISGAYFGDKISPLSDTTVVASSSCGVDLFAHIRYLMFTTGPSMLIALAVFLLEGLLKEPSIGELQHNGMLDTLHLTFNITPWVLIVPVITLILIACKLKTMLTLAISSLLGVVAMVIFQPQLPFNMELLKAIWSGAVFNTSDSGFNDLVSTSGVLGMLPTICLVISAMIFGGVMIGTGMIGSISTAVTKKLKGVKSIVGATIGSGLMLNGFTADQYLSIIIGANMYKEVYSRSGLESRKLSRTLEDSISVTSVLIPWNSCGLTQSAVLGVSTLAYFPYCVFNYLSPIMSFIVTTGCLKMKRGVVAGVRKVV